MLNLLKNKVNSGMGKDVVWTFSLQIAIMLCSFAITKLLASRLSVDEFGQYNLIKRSVQVLSFVMLAGVGIALPRYIPIYRSSNPPKSIRPLLQASLIYVIGVSCMVGLCCLLFSTEMQETIIGQGDHMSLFLVVLAYAFALAMAQFSYAYYRGVGDFKWYNGTQLGVQLAIVLPLILLPVINVTKVFVAWLIITSLLVAFYLGREWRMKTKEGKQQNAPMSSSLKAELTTIAKYSSGRLVADFFLFSLDAFPLIYISNTYGLQPTAYYSVGITFVTMVTPLFSFMGIILLPYVSQAIAKGDLQSANRFISRLSLLYVGFSLVITAFFYVFINFLTTLFFAHSYLVAADLSRIMILSILPQAIYLLYRNPIDAVSVVPYNTIILGICLAAMVITFLLCTTLTQLAWAYFGVSILQGLLSFLTWQFKKKE